ncbi:hypothetical protein HJG60_007916 [Phyllostomus discolor]|uniref:Uncharacterized protein n=1 Tax=Phyllostomus discolor TaxID=89673 RepID=A0A834BHN1_9CHIR|nr:hypothetical protein HJG60_007916 [Phyllostomus discolor]
MDRSSKQNINKHILALNNALDQMDLTDIYKNFHLRETKYTFFSNAHSIFLNTVHMIRHKTILNKFKKIEIISSIFSNHRVLKLETNFKEETQKHSNSWRLNNILLNNEWVDNEIKEEFKNCLETNAKEHTTVQNLWDIAKAVLRGNFIVIQIYLEKI